LSSKYKGKIMAITTSGRSIKEYSDRVTSEGGRLIALPTIEIVPSDPKVVRKFIQMINLGRHEICAFLSSNAVDVLFALAHRTNNFEELISVLNSRTIIAIGPNTRKRLEHLRVKVQAVPEDYSTQGLIKMLKKDVNSTKGKSIIIPRTNESDSSFKKSLLLLGMKNVDEVFVYSVKASQAGTSDVWKEFVSLLSMRMVDCIIFTSASSVRAFIRILKNNHRLSNVQDEINGIKIIISIVTLTWQELERQGVQATTAEIHTIRGAFEAVKKNLSF
jgi:uroporphyrinogen-III synthase